MGSLITAILEFSPQKRIKPIVALNHEFFKELRDPATTLPNGAPLPHRDLFDLKPEEMTTMLVDAEKSPNGGAGTGGISPFPEINGENNLSTDDKVKKYIAMLQQKPSAAAASEKSNLP